MKLQTQQQFVGAPWCVSLWLLGTLLLMVFVAGGIGGRRLIAAAHVASGATFGSIAGAELVKARRLLSELTVTISVPFECARILE
ncbi:hypothetical protein D3C81_1373130 [compost metagenome]